MVMAKMYKWQVQEAPTGRYRSFHRRGWPHASYVTDGSALARIECDDDYYAPRVKAGNHAPLKLFFANYNVDPVKDGGFKWLKVKGEFATLDEAKAQLDKVIA